MKQYLNLNGDSGISEYEIGNDFIEVKFKNNSSYTYTIYQYTYQSAGMMAIDEMKVLATTGRGLNHYINTNVKKKYASKR